VRPLVLTFYRSGLVRRWRWTLAHRNGNKISREAQGRGYGDLRDAEHGACLSLSGMDAEIVTSPETGAFLLTGRGYIEVVYKDFA
jgi:hypothetical protein